MYIVAKKWKAKQLCILWGPHIDWSRAIDCCDYGFGSRTAANRDAVVGNWMATQLTINSYRI